MSVASAARKRKPPLSEPESLGLSDPEDERSITEYVSCALTCYGITKADWSLRISDRVKSARKIDAPWYESIELHIEISRPFSALKQRGWISSPHNPVTVSEIQDVKSEVVDTLRLVGGEDAHSLISLIECYPIYRTLIEEARCFAEASASSVHKWSRGGPGQVYVQSQQKVFHAV